MPFIAIAIIIREYTKHAITELVDSYTQAISIRYYPYLPNTYKC